MEQTTRSAGTAVELKALSASWFARCLFRIAQLKKALIHPTSTGCNAGLAIGSDGFQQPMTNLSTHEVPTGGSACHECNGGVVICCTRTTAQ